MICKTLVGWFLPKFNHGVAMSQPMGLSARLSLDAVLSLTVPSFRRALALTPLVPPRYRTGPHCQRDLCYSVRLSHDPLL
jgi:hypothetical protein